MKMCFLSMALIVFSAISSFATSRCETLADRPVKSVGGAQVTTKHGNSSADLSVASVCYHDSNGVSYSGSIQHQPNDGILSANSFFQVTATNCKPTKCAHDEHYFHRTCEQCDGKGILSDGYTQLSFTGTCIQIDDQTERYTGVGCAGLKFDSNDKDDTVLSIGAGQNF